MKRIISALIAVSMSASLFVTYAGADSAYQIRINTAESKREVSEDLFGVNFDWIINGKNYVTDYDGNDFSPNMLVKSSLNEIAPPVIRLGEDASTKISWKDTIGDYSERPEKTLWGYTGAIKLGLVEEIKYWQSINPDASFTFTVNPYENVSDIADLAEFLSGDETTEWGAKRIAAGIEKPVDIKAYQLGNEQDWTDKLSADEYLSYAKPAIEAIKSRDAAAKIAVIGGTSMYNQYLKGTYDDSFMTGVVSGLKNDVDYVAFNWYMAWNRQDILNELLDKVSNSLDSIGATNVKIFLSEIACASSGIMDEKPNALWGSMELADMYASVMNSARVGMIAYHGFHTGPWGIIWLNPTKNESGITGNGLVYKAFEGFIGSNVVSSEVTGSGLSGFSAVTGDGRVQIALINKNSGAVNTAITFADAKAYNLSRSTVISGSDLYAINTETASSISSNEVKYDEGTGASSFSVPAYSVCILELSPKAEKELYAEDFSSSDIDSFTSVTDGGYAQITDGTLVLTDDSFGNNFLYLPTDMSGIGSYTFEADVVLYSDLGIVYGASDAEDLTSGGSGNIIKINSSSVTDESYNSGSSSVVSSKTGLSLGNTVHVLLSVTDSSIVFSADNFVVFSRANSGSGFGKIGFYYSYAQDSVDNIKIKTTESKKMIASAFEYSEDFNSVPDGELPEGYEVRNGFTRAWVEDGRLHINTDKDWHHIGSVVINQLGFVNKKDLTIEADVTSGGYSNEAWNAMGGFVYGLTEKGNGSAALGTWESTGRYVVLDSAEPGTVAKGEIGGSGFVSEGKTVKLKAVFGNNTVQPTIFVDQTEYSPSNIISKTASDYGEIGLFSQGSEIIIDNLKITGNSVSYYADNEYSEVLEDVSYSDDFESYTLGRGDWKRITDAVNVYGYSQLGNGGSGWSIEEADGNKYLVIDSGNTDYPYVVTLPMLDVVQNNGLTMEADMWVKPGSTTPSGSHKYGGGFIYGWDGTAASFGTVSHSACQDTRVSITNTAVDGIDTNDFAFKDTFVSDKGSKIHLRIVFNNSVKPDVYISDSEHDEVKVNIGSYMKSDTTEGNIGLYAINSKICMDNIRITAKQKKLVPNGQAVYSAKFDSDSAKFYSVEEAVGAVRVFKTVDGTAIDITAEASINAQMADDKHLNITVVYGSFKTVLTCEIISLASEGFLYEDDFESYTLGRGDWKRVTNAVDVYGYSQLGSGGSGWSIEEADGNKYLVIDSGNTDYPYVVTLPMLDVVQNNGLTMEADMWVKPGSTTPSGSHKYGGGFIYGWDGTAASFGTVSHSACQDTRVSITNTAVDGIDTNDFAFKDTFVSDKGSKIHLRIVFNNSVKPDVYISDSEHDEVKVNIGSYMKSDTTEGNIGLYAINSKICMDNIKISGIRKTESASAISKVQLLSSGYDEANSTLNVFYNVENASGFDVQVFAAVYNADGRLIGAAKAYNSVPNGRVSLFGNADISLTEAFADGCTVKLFAWDEASLKPAV